MPRCWDGEAIWASTPQPLHQAAIYFLSMSVQLASTRWGRDLIYHHFMFPSQCCHLETTVQFRDRLGEFPFRAFDILRNTRSKRVLTGPWEVSLRRL